MIDLSTANDPDSLFIDGVGAEATVVPVGGPLQIPLPLALPLPVQVPVPVPVPVSVALTCDAYPAGSYQKSSGE